ncbi:unnamed protein product [Amoebophrya sp. A25]|nr:unnamed protein product [Amoebophrya sp. A25]|eukprot:GSA25T00026608001.1
MDASSRARASMGLDTLAIIGGAGPEAGVDLMQKILMKNRELREKTDGLHYCTDRDAPYVVLFQVPGLGGPRNPDDLIDEEQEPFRLVWDSITDTIRKIDALQLDYFCISCNTLHVLAPRVRRFCEENSVSAKFVSIVDTVYARIRDIHQEASVACGAGDDSSAPFRIAVFGTFATTDLKSARSPYGGLLSPETILTPVGEDSQASQQRPLYPVFLPEGARSDLQRLIVDIKREGLQDKHAVHFRDEFLHKYKADCALLACTELPMLMPYINKLSTPSEIERASSSCTFLDATDLLADVLVHKLLRFK